MQSRFQEMRTSDTPGCAVRVGVCNTRAISPGWLPMTPRLACGANVSSVAIGGLTNISVRCSNWRVAQHVSQWHSCAGPSRSLRRWLFLVHAASGLDDVG
jgi:hypothetical protein